MRKDAEHGDGQKDGKHKRADIASRLAELHAEQLPEQGQHQCERDEEQALTRRGDDTGPHGHGDVLQQHVAHGHPDVYKGQAPSRVLAINKNGFERERLKKAVHRRC